MILWGDLETFSVTPITWGTYRYAADSEIMLFPYALDDDPPQCWDLTDGSPIPGDLDYALSEADEICFHNSMFDRTVLRLNKGRFRYETDIVRWRDTMVQALAHSMPGALDKVGTILGIDSERLKSREGKALIQLFCKPQKFNNPYTRSMFTTRAQFITAVDTAKARWQGRATRETHPARWKAFIDYAKQDIAAMRAIGQKLPSWNYRGAGTAPAGEQGLVGTKTSPGRFELDLWHLDQRVNDRGIAIDLELARTAVAAVHREMERLKGETIDFTFGQLPSTSAVDKTLEYLLGEFGVSLPDLQGSTIETRLRDPDLPDGVKFLLMQRQQVATTSTSKYNALIRGTSADGRMRGTLQFCGAGRTGRWAGRTFQPHNLPSRNLLPPDEIEAGIEDIKAGIADVLHKNVMRLCSSAIRGCLVAPPKRKLVIADFSNIEGRDQAWLTGETWKLEAFRRFDTFIETDDGEMVRAGPDMYKLAYAKSFGIDHTAVDKEQRQVGKVQELALGYEGGVGAFLTFSLVYGIDLEAMAEQGEATIPSNIWEEAEGMWDWYLRKGKSTFGLSKRAFMVCDSFKRMWRYAHPKISAHWRELADAVRLAISNPETRFDCGMLKIKRSGQWLRVQLPSGRTLVYPRPRILAGNIISYEGVNQYTHKWGRIHTYGGKLFENVCQAVARDFMAYSMPLAEAAGYEIVLTVHDELVTETPDSKEFSTEGLVNILQTVPPWATGMPLAAAGFETMRYRKG